MPQASLTASLVFTWLMGSQDVTGSTMTTSSTISILTREETTPSVFNYTCRFAVNVAGDPPYQGEVDTNVVVTGMCGQKSQKFKVNFSVLYSHKLIC